jgi:hypothetical protein
MLDGLFKGVGLTAHGFCLSWDPALLSLRVASDLLIGLAYFSIPLALTAFVIRRRDLAFRGMFCLFVAALTTGRRRKHFLHRRDRSLST